MVRGGGLFGGKGKNYDRNDGCIGDRKVRTITFCVILIAFNAFGISYFLDQKDFWPDQNVDVPFYGDSCPKCVDAGHAWTMIVAAAFTVIASSIFAIILFFVNCDDKLGRAAGVGLVIGGALYIIGWTWYIALYHDMIDGIFDLVSDDTVDRINMMLCAWFGEALLPAACAFLLGLDVFMHLFDNESHRLAFNLLTIAVVAFLTGPVYYTLMEDDDSITVLNFAGFMYDSDAYPWIATGYMLLGCFCLLYVVLYICTCCTCDCKDNKIVRLFMALGLIVGGVLAAIGYWIYAGEFTSDNADEPTNYTLYYIGYTIAVAGFPIMWALDVGVDDLRGD